MSTSSEILSVTAAAEQRNSIRKYTDEAIPEATVKEIMRVAGLAPSPWNVQPWRVKVVTSQADKDKLMEAAYGQPQVGAAAAVFVVYSDMEDAVSNAIEFVHPGFGERREAEAENIVKTFRGMPDMHQWGHGISYIFVGFLLLAIQSQGYSSSAMLGFDPAKVKELYGLSETASVPTIIAVGKPAEAGFPHHRHEVDRFVDFV
jgi:nitroreductase